MQLRVQIAQHELGLLFVNGDYRGVLDPGRHALLGRFAVGRRVEVLKVSVLRDLFAHELLDIFVQDGAFRERVEVLDVATGELALVERDGIPSDVLGPGRHACVKGPFELSVERVSAPAGGRFEHPRLDAVLRAGGAGEAFESVNVDAGRRGLVFRGGKLIDELGEGRHVLFADRPNLVVRQVDMREQQLDVQGQGILTADRRSVVGGRGGESRAAARVVF
jgi:hypothetical protein